MELENIVANTVLLKAREGERAAGGEGRLRASLSQSPLRGAMTAGVRAGTGGAARRSRCHVAEPALETALFSPGEKENIAFPSVYGGLGKEVNEIAEITIFAHLFLPPSRPPPYPPPHPPPQIWSHRLCYFSVYC